MGDIVFDFDGNSSHISIFRFRRRSRTYSQMDFHSIPRSLRNLTD